MPKSTKLFFTKWVVISGLLVGSKDILYLCINHLLTYRVVTYFPTIALTSYIKVTKVKPGINGVEVHPQLS